MILTAKGGEQAVTRVKIMIPNSGNGEAILFSERDQRIGTPTYKIQTDLTLDATDAEIAAELERYAAARYKAISMFVFAEILEYKQMAEATAAALPF